MHNTNSAAAGAAACLLTLIATLLAPVSQADTTPSLINRPVLTLATAQRMAKACEARQLSQKRPPVSIAIYDQGANLLLFHRMTRASLGSAAVAMEKGKSTAHFAVPTRYWGKAAYGDKGSLAIAFSSSITTLTGGLPIKTEQGVHLGGIGVSGSSGDDDEACAQAAIDAVKADISTATKP